MNKVKSTKRALFSAVLALVVCISMLIGTTFAWFTDSVTSGRNIIQSGNLKVTMEWAKGVEDPDNANWNDASTGAIFSGDVLWEPGYTEVRHIRINNIGSLAFKYVVSILPNGEVSDLANVIDVYYVDPAMQVSERTELSELDRLGTLAEVLKDMPASAQGNLASRESDVITIALKMQESAGNEYENKAIGSDFSIRILATQHTYEEDSFDNQYDEVTLVTNAEELKNALADGKKPVLPDGSIYEEPEEAIVVWNTTELTSTLKKANNGKTVFLAAGEYTIPQISKTDVKDITIVGTSLANITGMTVYKTNVINNYTFENVTFTGDVKAHFYGNTTFKNCEFNAVGIAQSSYVTASGTLTIEGCTFNGTGEKASLHFGGKDGGTIIVKKCVFNKGGVVFGKAMNIIFEECDFNGTAVECYGSYTLNNCTFDADAQVYIHPNTGATEVNLTMNGCSVDGGADVTSVCYNTGNANGGVKTITIDGKVYNHDALQAFPSN